MLLHYHLKLLLLLCAIVYSSFLILINILPPSRCQDGTKESTLIPRPTEQAHSHHEHLDEISLESQHLVERSHHKQVDSNPLVRKTLYKIKAMGPNGKAKTSSFKKKGKATEASQLGTENESHVTNKYLWKQGERIQDFCQEKPWRNSLLGKLSSNFLFQTLFFKCDHQIDKQ